MYGLPSHDFRHWGRAALIPCSPPLMQDVKKPSKPAWKKVGHVFVTCCCCAAPLCSCTSLFAFPIQPQIRHRP